MGKQIIILGMHRSGTSVVTGLINMMGAYFGPESISTGSPWENQKGFWERRDIRNLNNFLLSEAGAEWDRVADFIPESVPKSARSFFKQRAQNLIDELDEREPWVAKEPRFCILFSFWRPVLSDPICILTLRNPVEVAKSLLSRNKIPMQCGIALWEYYCLAALRGSIGLPRTIVSYADIMCNPVETINTLWSFLHDSGVQGLKKPDDKQVRDFVDPKLYRERISLDEIVSFLNTDQQKLFESLVDHSAISWAEVPEVSCSTKDILRIYDYLKELEKDNKKLYGWMKELDRYVHRLLKSKQYNLGRTIGSIFRFIMGRQSTLSFPEQMLRRTLDEILAHMHDRPATDSMGNRYYDR